MHGWSVLSRHGQESKDAHIASLLRETCERLLAPPRTCTGGYERTRDHFHLCLMSASH